MNPDAIKLYEEHNIHLVAEPLEVAVCAQHNNGGLAGNLWWESENIKHLFPIGEVNGSHGICRPGGSALNSGQVAGIRAAEFIAAEYRERSLDADTFDAAATQALERLTAWTEKSGQAEITWETAREEFRQRMTRAGAQIRSVDELSDAVDAAWLQYGRMLNEGCKYDDAEGMVEALRNLHLCLAHAVYLDAVSRSVHDGTGSRGSGLVLAQDGVKLHDALEDYWRCVPENKSFRDKVLESAYTAPGCVKHHWSVCRSLPHEDGWFENIWADYRRKMIFK
jgi:succinate dehydrogenase/fumarate reductase flavoprotein subunit